MEARRTQREEPGRQAERMALDEPTRLRPNDWSSLEVRIVDLSRSGFRARCDAKLPIGGCVSLDMPGIGPVEAQVEWQRDDLLGAKFLHPVSLESCAWMPRRPVLAELLVQRANASQAGRLSAERRIRAKIIGGLPMWSQSAAEG